MGWLTIDAARPAGSGRVEAGWRSRPIERKLALVAVITTLLALLPGVLGEDRGGRTAGDGMAYESVDGGASGGGVNEGNGKGRRQRG